jgi:anhydro-N-acetylmuramic acid kinase
MGQNVTLIHGQSLYACDCGPGNALIDDWVSARCGVPYDEGGKIAAAGRVDSHVLSALLSNSYFTQSGPKSLDRNAFSSAAVSVLSAQDGAATLDELRRRLKVSVRVAEDFGWDGGAIEAQAFGYLAVRSVLRLPLSWPDTTGVREPVTGGLRWTPDAHGGGSASR